MTPSTVIFDCAGESLVGIIDSPSQYCSTGLLIVVGGPQYRVGSHRQFVLLARALAQAGFVVMRFDYRGMGDSTGSARSFEAIVPDMRAAIDAFFHEAPYLDRVVVWGLCDAASAALFFGFRDRRVAGLVLANPWVRTQASEARVVLKHYYWRRLSSRNFWGKFFSGKLDVGASARSILANLFKLRNEEPASGAADDALTGTLPDRMAEGWRRFGGPILLLLSGDDLTAQEFVEVTRKSRSWAGLLSEARVTSRTWQDANHTFSTRVWRDAVSAETALWLSKIHDQAERTKGKAS